LNLFRGTGDRFLDKDTKSRKKRSPLTELQKESRNIEKERNKHLLLGDEALQKWKTTKDEKFKREAQKHYNEANKL